VENVYIILQQIYPGNSVPNFVSIARVLYLQNIWHLFWT